jgi:hypothetical protein
MPALLLVLALSLQGAECADAAECRAKALDAASRSDYELFHDLAWRAIQKGPPRDPELMYLLARAQALSGRPGDALVMLRRLAEKGVPNDAATSEDFGRVRELPGWAEVEALAGGVKPASSPSMTAAAPAPRAEAALLPAAPEGRTADASKGDTADEVRFDARRFVPGGLAYDAVSRRFVLGDRSARKLFVVDERSGRANDLVGAGSAGFNDVVDLAIDPRRGDLWVVSTTDGAPDKVESVLHKLQLVSGRPLGVFHPPAESDPVKFVDVSVGADGTVFALDAAGRRLLRVRPGSDGFDRVAALETLEPLSLAIASDGVVFVSHSSGLSRVELPAGRITKVGSSGDEAALAGLERIRWTRGSIVAVQRQPDDSRRIVRLRLDRRGRKTTAIDVLESSAPASAAGAAAIAGNAFVYLIADERGTIVRRVPLR